MLSLRSRRQAGETTVARNTGTGSPCEELLYRLEVTGGILSRPDTQLHLGRKPKMFTLPSGWFGHEPKFRSI